MQDNERDMSMSEPFPYAAVAAEMRKQNGPPPSAAMTPGEHASAEAIHAVINALDALAKVENVPTK